MTEGDGRRDVVIVLARGHGRRAGGPKGLLRAADDPRTLAERLLALYGPLQRDVFVVTLLPLVESHRAALPASPRLHVVGAPGGGDTARTFFAGWRAAVRASRRGSPPTHVWAHPVDLPLVTSDTLDRLHAASCENPDAVVRPAWSGRPGHPVVVPAAEAARLLGERPRWSGPMLALWTASPPARPAVVVAVDDEGVCRDFDTADDLEAAGRPRGAEEENHDR